MASQLFQTVHFTPPPHREDASVISFINPTSTDFQANIVVAQHDLAGLPLAEYAKAQSLDFSAEVDEYEILQSQEHSVDGTNAYTLEHVFLADESGRVHQLILFLQSESQVYSISCTHSGEEFEEMRSVFEETVATFRLR